MHNNNQSRVLNAAEIQQRQAELRQRAGWGNMLLNRVRDAANRFLGNEDDSVRPSADPSQHLSQSRAQQVDFSALRRDNNNLNRSELLSSIQAQARGRSMHSNNNNSSMAPNVGGRFGTMQRSNSVPPIFQSAASRASGSAAPVHNSLGSSLGASAAVFGRQVAARCFGSVGMPAPTTGIKRPAPGTGFAGGGSSAMNRSQSVPQKKVRQWAYEEEIPQDGILLVVGDGNLTFCEVLSKAAKDKATVFSTTYHSLEELQELYPDAIDATISRIEANGSKVLHGVDAMNLQETFGVGTKWYDFVPEPKKNLKLKRLKEMEAKKAEVAKKRAEQKARIQKKIADREAQTQDKTRAAEAKKRAEAAKAKVIAKTSVFQQAKATAEAKKAAALKAAAQAAKLNSAKKEVVSKPNVAKPATKGAAFVRKMAPKKAAFKSTTSAKKTIIQKDEAPAMPPPQKSPAVSQKSAASAVSEQSTSKSAVSSSAASTAKSKPKAQPRTVAEIRAKINLQRKLKNQEQLKSSISTTSSKASSTTGDAEKVVEKAAAKSHAKAVSPAKAKDSEAKVANAKEDKTAAAKVSPEKTLSEPEKEQSITEEPAAPKRSWPIWFDTVLWNFPHAGCVKGFHDGHEYVHWRHVNLMRKFFKSVRQVMKTGGVVKVSTNEKSTGVDANDMVQSAKLNGFKLLRKVPFNDWSLSNYDRAFGDYRDVAKRHGRGSDRGRSDKYQQSKNLDFLYVFEMLEAPEADCPLMQAPSPSDVMQNVRVCKCGLICPMEKVDTNKDHHFRPGGDHAELEGLNKASAVEDLLMSFSPFT